MKLRSLQETDVRNKTVLLRVDFNVPLEALNHNSIADDARIRASLPTIQHLLDQNCKTIILTSLGRPDGVVKPELKLDQIAQHLQTLLNHPVKKIGSVVGPEVTAAATALQPQDILMLENVRFHPGETKNDAGLAQEWSKLGQIVVNDAFSVSHRAHASVAAIADFLPMAAGLQLQKEVEMLSVLMENPARPFVTIVGGAKISDKVEVIRRLTQIADTILVGGGVANNFLKAEGIDVMNSYLEEKSSGENSQKSFVALAGELLTENKEGNKIRYPIDVVAGDSIDATTHTEIIDFTVPPKAPERIGLRFLDIGPKTQQLFREVILSAKTVFWNGPMGVFENSQFKAGTQAVAQAMAEVDGTTIIGGGDTNSAMRIFGLSDKYDFVSTAGGASLEFLAGKMLPGIKPMIVL